MLPDTVETGRQAVADNCSQRHLAACTQLPPARSAMPQAPLLHQLSPEREREGTRGSAVAPTPCCRAGECPGAAAMGSGSVTEHGSGGTVMAAGSSPALPMPGSTGVGGGHQRTVSTQQPLACKLPGCPIPLASSFCHGDHPKLSLL